MERETGCLRRNPSCNAPERGWLDSCISQRLSGLLPHPPIIRFPFCSRRHELQKRVATVILVAIRSRHFLDMQHRGGTQLRCSDLFHRTRDRSERITEQLRTAVLPWAPPSALSPIHRLTAIATGPCHRLAVSVFHKPTRERTGPSPAASG